LLSSNIRPMVHLFGRSIENPPSTSPLLTLLLLMRLGAQRRTVERSGGFR
jgi:hypothetical protein